DINSREGIASIPKILHGFLEKIANTTNCKSFVICKNISEAEKVYEIFQRISGSTRPVLIHSKIPSASDLLRRFNMENRYSVAIIVDLYLGIDFPKLTDLVLLRKFPDELALTQAVSRVMRVSD